MSYEFYFAKLLVPVSGASPKRPPSLLPEKREVAAPGAMAGPAAHPAIVRRRGNPRWGQPIPFTPALPTEFEIQVRQLRLTPETYVHSAELRNWCERNKNRIYIPEWLLEEWNIPVDPNFSDAA